MSVDRTQKEQAVAELNETFTQSGLVVVTHYKGMTVAEMTDLRAKMREENATVKVTKNRLAQRALEGTGYEGLSEMFSGPTAVAVSEDPISAAKVAYNYAKDNEKLVILGGAMGDTILDQKGVEALAKLPSLDEVRGKLVAMLSTPATRIATVSGAPATQIARVLKAYAEKG